MGQVTTETHGQTELIRYSNAPGGLMDAAGANAMLSAVKKAVADLGVRVIVITGADDVFVRHYDVAEIAQVADALRKGLITSRQMEHAPFVDVGDQIAAAGKPVIAAINGVCMGGGLELALACDIRIAGAGVTQIGLPETRIGIFPGGGGTQRLARLIGEGRALDMILRGRIVDAETAQKMGIVSEVAADPVAAALEAAAEMAAMPAGGLAAAKKLVRSALDENAGNGLLNERRKFADLLKADNEAFERMRRFVAEGGQLG